MTPLYNVPYEEQLKIKVTRVENFLQRAAQWLKKTLPVSIHNYDFIETIIASLL